MTSRELVRNTLEFRNSHCRAPRDLWTLPWADIHHGEALAAIRRRFPNDYGGVPVIYRETSPVETGDPYAAGEYTDPYRGHGFPVVSRGRTGRRHLFLTGQTRFPDRRFEKESQCWWPSYPLLFP